MGSRPNTDNTVERRNGGGPPSNGWLLDWRVLVGLISIVGGVFVGSRTIATQEDLRLLEARTAQERTRNKEAAAIAYADVGTRIERLWEELQRRESLAFRQKDAELLKELLRSEIRGHKHED